MKFSDEIHNYYEALVAEVLDANTELTQSLNEGELADLWCLTLNQLPARYIRHDVDIAYYLSSSEHSEMQKSVNEAVENALARINNPEVN